MSLLGVVSRGIIVSAGAIRDLGGFEERRRQRRRPEARRARSIRAMGDRGGAMEEDEEQHQLRAAHTRWTRGHKGSRLAPTGASSASAEQGLTPDLLFSRLEGLEDQELPARPKPTKVTVVGVGNVGMACAQTILTQNLVDEIALVDVQAEKLRGEMLDLQHAAAFLPRVKIVADTDYSVTAHSDICIITAGARQREGEDRMSLVERNFALFKNIIPELVKYSPHTMLLVITNPVDILSWVSWKLSGLPPNRVIGSGTNLDTSRFRTLLGNHFNVSVHNVHATIVGEHGDSSVPLWSGVTVGGVPLAAFAKEHGIATDPEVFTKAHKYVVDGAYEVIKLKGYTSWAIGYSAAALVSSVLRNQRRVHPVSVLAQGFHGIDMEVFLSLPSMLGRSGVIAVANSVLLEHEAAMLRKSAQAIWSIQSKLQF